VTRRLRAALATLVVGGAAYAGLFLLLTAEDRRERAALLALDGDAVRSAPEPGPQPPGGDSAAVRAWNRAQDLHRSRAEYERRSRKIRMFGIGLFGAFALQSVATAVVLVRASRSPPPAPARERDRALPDARGPRS
jgi:hypothetical protein